MNQIMMPIKNIAIQSFSFYFSIVLLAFLLCSQDLNSQINLVSNPSFENHSQCPNFGGQIDRSNGWDNVNLITGNFSVGSPDYFHTCGSGTTVPPNTFAGQCNPHTGNAMAALVMYNIPYPGYREYMSTPLSCPMTPGNTYTVSFWMTNGLAPISQYRIKNIGVHFSAAPLTQSGFSIINVVPQVEITALSGSTTWTNYTFTVNPTASWQRLTIGCFRPDAQNSPTATYALVPGPASVYANYFFDDIEVWAPFSQSIGLSSALSPSICVGQSTVIEPNGSTSYSINPGNLTGQSFTVSPSTTTIYTISASNSGCASSSQTVSVFVNPTPLLSSRSYTLCAGNSATLTASPALSYTWYPSGINSQSIVIQPSTSTSYTAVGNNGVCTSSMVASVLVNSTFPINAGRDTIIDIGESVLLSGSGDIEVGFVPIGSEPLSCNFCPKVEVQPSERTCYVLKGSNGKGCVGADTVCVDVRKDWAVYIPNAFTPNGDDYNDVFMPVGFGLTEIRLTIFDKWGEVLFRSHDNIIGWDGIYQGKLCQQDVYVYQVEMKTVAGNTVKRTGHVTILD